MTHDMTSWSVSDGTLSPPLTIVSLSSKESSIRYSILISSCGSPVIHMHCSIFTEVDDGTHSRCRLQMKRVRSFNSNYAQSQAVDSPSNFWSDPLILSLWNLADPTHTSFE
jgi:hypothetical protein